MSLSNATTLDINTRISIPSSDDSYSIAELGHRTSSDAFTLEVNKRWEATPRSLESFINTHLIAYSVGLAIAFMLLLLSAFLRNVYAIAIMLVITYGFFEMVITIVVDKRNTK